MKRLIFSFLILSLILCGCGVQEPKTSSAAVSSGAQELALTDSDGVKLSVPGNPRVVCLYGSFAEAWRLAGGTLAGVTEDALEERALEVGDAVVVGTVKEPNTEEIIALDPDLVLLSSDIVPQREVQDVLENAGLACAYFRVDTFDDYDSMMREFCGVTGRDDLYEENVTRVRAQIEAVQEAFARRDFSPSVLLIRAFSSGIRAKTDDELAGAILKDLGAHNIADDHPSMLEDLSLEEVIAADPEYIFVTTMGSEEKALAYLDSLIDGNPAWQELSAVKEGRYVALPKELFHYKPNNRWGESYEYLARCFDPSYGE